jgi:hypothetical protein
MCKCIKMKQLYIVFFLFLFNLNSYSQLKSSYYELNFIDGKNYVLTMNQSNDLMLQSLKGNELFIDLKSLNNKQQKIYILSQTLFTAFLGQAITHEEGHRSVLTELGIGSVSKPFFDKNLVAKVTGVTDETLMNLRETDFPNYMRLHTAGLESDYAYLKKEDHLFNFNEEDYGTIYGDYFARKLGSQVYYLTLLFKTKVDIKEQDDKELDRDIVGHDIYGMIRHLHRPKMEFYRYTNFNQLTTEEQKFAKKIGYLSLFNLLNPNIWRGKKTHLTENTMATPSFSFSLAPFGYFIEENMSLLINNKLKLSPYARQYFNKDNMFLSFGIGLHNYAFKNEKFILNSNLDLWNQPKDLKFETSTKEFGFSIKNSLGIQFSKWNENKNRAYCNIGISYKTNGFVPEAPSLYDDFRFHLGLILSMQK